MHVFVHRRIKWVTFILRTPINCIISYYSVVAVKRNYKKVNKKTQDKTRV